MLVQKYKNFSSFVKKNIPSKGKQKITEAEFDDFISTILTNEKLTSRDKIYCRDGFAYVKEIDRKTYQVIAFQINTFAKGAFKDTEVKFCTPLLLTIKVHGSYRHGERTLKDTPLSLEEFYLGKHYSGSKGDACDREKLADATKKIFQSEPRTHSFRHEIIYMLINTNYVCHHIAETMGYVYGAMDLFWYTKKDKVYMVSGSEYLEKKSKLNIEIIDNFSFERMRSSFSVPQYVKLPGDINKFREEYDLMLWEVMYKRERESFYLPAGYQKTPKKRFNKPVNVITSQHIVEYILASYYKRMNTYIVSTTFQALEFLSRAILAKSEGKDEEGGHFLKSVSACMGHYPDRKIDEILKKTDEKYPFFVSDYAHSMFFRPPVLK